MYGCMHMLRTVQTACDLEAQMCPMHSVIVMLHPAQARDGQRCSPNSVVLPEPEGPISADISPAHKEPMRLQTDPFNRVAEKYFAA